jgi:hypothetical protein
MGREETRFYVPTMPQEQLQELAEGAQLQMSWLTWQAC